MARRKNPPESVRAKTALADRLRLIRTEKYGERGGPELARHLGLPIRTWYNYETGVTVPAEVLLKFIDMTGANPVYLLTGHGNHFQDGAGKPGREFSIEELLRHALERLEARAGEGRNGGRGPSGDQVPIGIVPFEGLGEGTPEDATGEILAPRDWIPNPAKTIAARVPDGAMDPVL